MFSSSEHLFPNLIEMLNGLLVSRTEDIADPPRSPNLSHPKRVAQTEEVTLPVVSSGESQHSRTTQYRVAPLQMMASQQKLVAILGWASEDLGGISRKISGSHPNLQG
tara:strand:+ start:312 stop:635 length:324 start_codon:yes stop_codon:yes gene_type:complete